MLQDEILPWFEKNKKKEKKKRKKNGSYHFEFSTQNEKLVAHASAPRRTSVCDKLTKKNTLINIQSECFPRGTKIAVSELTKNIWIDGPDNYQLDLFFHTTRVKDSSPPSGACHPIHQTIAAARNAALIPRKPSLHHETRAVHELCNYYHWIHSLTVNIFLHSILCT